MICGHFGACGGCLYQDLPYEEQVVRKQHTLEALFAGVGVTSVPVELSPVQWHYRNKVDFSFARKWYPEPPAKGFERESVLGFKTRGRWYQPLEVEDCLIGPEGLSSLLAGVRVLMGEQHLQAFDSRSKRGFVKILLVREGKRTGQRMVVLTTAEGELDRGAFTRMVLDTFPATSVYWGVFRGTADVAAADESVLLYGEPVIEEQLYVGGEGGERLLRFRISPFSFFQTNTFATERLYGGIRAWLSQEPVERLYDLYGGAGGIAFTCSDLVSDVVSVESVVSATEDGRVNAVLNGIENVTFFTAKVEDYLAELQVQGVPERSAVVVDPPRAGLHPKALARLVELRLPRLLYVSCNPEILAREMPVLLEGYRIESMRGVDLFPHTAHVEVLASLVARQ